MTASFLFAKSHEWVKKEQDGSILVGISDHAQTEMGDLVYVSLPTLGSKLISGEIFAEIESVKAVSGVYSPASGIVLEVNSELEESPEKINESPYETWLVRIGEPTEFTELLNDIQYGEFIKQEGA